MGCFVLLANKQFSKLDILNSYRQRDSVEKIFDILKDEIDGDRLRIHNKYTMDGRLFLKFITLILYSEISKIMSSKNLFKKYSLREMLKELAKLKITRIKDYKPIISELSKKQRLIFEAFGISLDQIT
jgi:transposase